MSRDRVPDWLVERMVAGDLPPDQAEEIRRRLQDEPGGPARLEALLASNEAILQAHPPARVAAAIRQRADGGAPRPTLLRYAPILAAPALAIAVFALVDFGPQAPAPVEETIRFKGDGPALLIFRQAENDAERLRPGATTSAGDRLQIGYQSAGASFGAIVSVDGEGNVTQHLPYPGKEAVPLEPGTTLLPVSFELDDAPAFERFVLVTSSDPFELGPILEAARQLRRSDDPAHAPLQIPDSLSQTSFLVEKK